MARQPYSRTLLVTVSRAAIQTRRRGLSTPLFLTSQGVVGKLSASLRTREYASMDEVEVDFSAGDAFYDAAEAAFSQDPAPIRIKAGFYTAPTSGDITENDMKDELDAIADYDPDFYGVGIEEDLHDKAGAQAVIEWTQANGRLAAIESADAAMELANDTTSIAGVNKNLYDRSGVFYHTDSGKYLGFAALASALTNNFDEANARYTMKFKRIVGIAPIDKPSSVITAITGFVPQVGQGAVTGNMANTVIDIDGTYFLVEGSTLTSNVFMDEIHATDWVRMRSEEELLNLLLKNKSIPYTDEGMEMLASVPRRIMAQGRRAGIVDGDRFDPETRQTLPGVIYEIPSVFDVLESQRRARIAPEITVKFRYPGSVHYATLRYSVAI